jgi:hypothetical protein
MKLLLHTHSLAPSIGGLETIVASLAAGLAELRTICPNGQPLQEPSRSPCPGHFMVRRRSS